MAESTSSTSATSLPTTPNTNPSTSITTSANTSNNLPSFINPHNIVTVKLNRDNFLLWKAQIIPYMRGQRVFGFIDGTITPPPQVIPNPDTTSTIDSIGNPEFLTWVQQDQLIMSTLLSSLTEGVLTQVVGCTTSRDLWMALERMFTSQSRARIMQIHYQLATAKKGGSSISDYFQKFKGLADTLAAAGQPLNDFEIVSYLLAGLGPEYDPFVTSVTTRVDPLSIDELYGHLLAHENRLEQHHNVAAEAFPSANLASKSQPSRGRGSRGSSPSSGGRNNSASFRGHRGRGRGGRTTSYPSTGPHPFGPSSGTTRPTCQVCNKMGHTALKCYNRFNHAYHGESSSSQLAAFVAGSPPSADYNWYPDTGATNHLTSDLNNLNLQSEEYVGTDQIHVGNGAGSSFGTHPPSRAE